MEELRTILKELKNILGQEGLTDIEQKDVLEQSVKIYLTDRINKLGISTPKVKEKVDSGVNAKEIDKVELASDKQIALLKQLNKFKEGLTKQEAWAIINTSKRKNQEY